VIIPHFTLCGNCLHSVIYFKISEEEKYSVFFSDHSAPLHLACEVGAAASATLLVNKGANPKATDDVAGWTALHWAARNKGLFHIYSFK